MGRPPVKPRGRSGTRPVPAADAGGGGLDVAEDALDVGVVLAAALGEADPAVAAVEQRGAEMGFEHADAVGDGGGGDLQLVGRADEALVPGGGIEEAEAVERRQRVHGRGGRAASSGHSHINGIPLTKHDFPWLPGSMLVVLRRVGRPGIPTTKRNATPPKHQPGHEPRTGRVVIPVRPVGGHRVRGALGRWQLRHDVTETS